VKVLLDAEDTHQSAASTPIPAAPEEVAAAASTQGEDLTPLETAVPVPEPTVSLPVPAADGKSDALEIAYRCELHLT